jgi:hypothetical protein
MPTIIISGPAQAFAENPSASEPITDRKTLARFHGLGSEQTPEFFDDPLVNNLGVSGGCLRFVLDDKTSTLRIVSAFHVPRRLTAEEIQRLVEATTGQWSDGSGSGSFENFYGTVMSTALAIGLRNTGQWKAIFGDYFVDAFPLFTNDEEARVEFLDSDEPEKTDLDYLQEAASFGEPQAQFTLARQLQDGDGIQKNERLAFENYQKAADQGHLMALTFLGLCYQLGTGIDQDVKRGFECFETAAKEDVPLAWHCLGECYIEGRGVEANPNEGIKCYRRGVELGDMGCTAELGDCYEFGKGVPQDLRQALELYERCMEGGFDAVEPAVNRVKKQLNKPSGK